jgi:hypothetical protein
VRPIQRRDVAAGVLSPGNSTDIPLAPGGEWTGEAEKNTYPEMMVIVQTDNAGTLIVEFSIDDGANWSAFPVDGFRVTSGINEFHVAVKGPRLTRVRHINNGGTQTYLRIATYFGSNFSGANAPANQTAGRGTDAQMVRMYDDPQDEIIMGNRTGVTAWNKFGHRPDLDTSDGEAIIIADSTTNTLEIMTAPDTFTVGFDVSVDGHGTSGVTEMEVWYIDDQGHFAQNTVLLDDSGSMETPFSGYGINRVAIVDTGNGPNVSDISFRASGSGSMQAFVPAGEGVTQQAFFHVPVNARGVLKFLYMNVNRGQGKAPQVQFKGFIHNRNISAGFEIFRTDMDAQTDHHLGIIEPVGFALTPFDVLYFTAQTDTNNTKISEFRFSMNVYEDN